MQRSFNWEQAKTEAIGLEIAVEKIHAKRGNVQDKLSHPNWVRDAKNNDYTDLVKVTTENMLKLQENAIQRRAKRAGSK